jgi:hypothetical protein
VPRALAPLLLVAAALSGCLGYGDENVVADVIKQAYTQANVADCADRETRRFAEQTTLFTGAGAVLMCRTLELKVQPAKSVAVSGVRVSGNTATARVVERGGAANGRRETIRLVKDAKGWKLDRIVALHLSRRGVENVYRQLLSNAPKLPGLRPACLLRAIRGIPVATLEQAFLENDRSAVFAAASGCVTAAGKKKRP